MCKGYGCFVVAPQLLLVGLPWSLAALWRLAYTLSSPGAVVAAILHIVTFLILWCLVVCGDPGVIGRGWTQSTWEQTFPELLLGVEWRWRTCTICDAARPPGAQHCRSCKVCVMGVDHHCPFFGQCIGARNMNIFTFAVLFGYGSLLVVASTMPVIIASLVLEYGTARASNAYLPWLRNVAHGVGALHFIVWLAAVLAFLYREFVPHAFTLCAPWTARTRTLRRAVSTIGAPSTAKTALEDPAGDDLASSDSPLTAAQSIAHLILSLHGRLVHWYPREPLGFAPHAADGSSRRTTAPGLKRGGNRYNRAARELAAMRGHRNGIWSPLWSRWPSRYVSLLPTDGAHLREARSGE